MLIEDAISSSSFGSDYDEYEKMYLQEKQNAEREERQRKNKQQRKLNLEKGRKSIDNTSLPEFKHFSTAVESRNFTRNFNRNNRTSVQEQRATTVLP